jgi:leucyl aminopeptidase
VNGWICDNCRQSSFDTSPHDRSWKSVPEGWSVQAAIGRPPSWVACSVGCAEQLRKKTQIKTPDEYRISLPFQQYQEACKERDEVRQELQQEKERSAFYKAENERALNVLHAAGFSGGLVDKVVEALVSELMRYRTSSLRTNVASVSDPLVERLVKLKSRSVNGILSVAGAAECVPELIDILYQHLRHDHVPHEEGESEPHGARP